MELASAIRFRRGHGVVAEFGQLRTFGAQSLAFYTAIAQDTPADNIDNNKRERSNETKNLGG